MRLFRLALILGGLAVAGGLIGWFAVSLSLTGEQVITPDLRELLLVDALKRTEEMGLFLRLEQAQFDESLPRDMIISQRPAPGMMIKKGRQISVVVSKGVREVSVPDLADLPWREMDSYLARVGLQAGMIARVHSETYPRDRIIAQEPLPGQPVNHGNTVNVLVSLGPAPPYYVTPDWIGKSARQVQDEIDRLNLRLEISERRIMPDLPSDTIIDQHPRSGYRIRAGDIIRVVVSRSSESERPTDVDHVPFLYIVPAGLYPRELRIALIDRSGAMVQELYRREVLPGERVSLLVPRRQDATLAIYLNDDLVSREEIPNGT